MDRTQLTPLFVQYYELKDQYPECLMLMRVGDFFEAYGADAETLARDAEIALTSKEAGGGQRLAMAGVPFFSVDPYVRVLIEKGHRVAIGDQMEAATPGKGLVRREVTRVVTAGTVLDPQMLEEQRHNYLLCLASVGGEVGLAAADVTTGEYVCTELPAEPSRVLEEVYRYRPAELVLAGVGDGLTGAVRALETATVERALTLDHASAEAMLCEQFGGCDLVGRAAATVAAAALLSYLRETQLARGVALEAPRGYLPGACMVLDTTSQRNLELTETLLGRERKGSLLWAMDYTCTSMGARQLRQWMLRPLLDRRDILRRSAAVERLVLDYPLTQDLRERLARVRDIERLLSRVVYQTANARDLLSLQGSLSIFPELRETARRAGVDLLDELTARLDVDLALVELLERAISPDAPVSLREGGLIRSGFHAGVDELRNARTSAKEWIASLEERERQSSGIRSLKVGFNQVFGYYLEVTKANQKLVPAEWTRKQTLANAERYITSELKEVEARVLGAEDKLRELEYELFSTVRDQVAAQASELRRAARAAAELDVLVGLAEGAVRHNWVRPEIVEENVLHVVGGRHPVVERALEGVFVANDCRLDADERLIVLTGPNMSGKSTWLRQNALIQVMAQMGSFVPASSARLGLADRVFTRVGASDDLHLGQSTFMVEMSEAANILVNATPRSLVILDEIGRGTSTFDGLALARSIAEHLYLTTRAKTLFATHFHELTGLAKEFGGVRNYRVAVQENRDEIIFLHRIVPGGADKSYGIYVAQLAGLPEPVLTRARQLLAELEKGTARARRDKSGERQQLSLFADPAGVLDDLRRLDPAAVPVGEVLGLVAGWKARL